MHRDTREIIDGFHRWSALQWVNTEEPLREGDPDLRGVYDTIDIVLSPPGYSPEQMRIATLRHNRARGQEDMDLAADVLRDLQKLGALDRAGEALMMSPEELGLIMQDVTLEPEPIPSEIVAEIEIEAQNTAGPGEASEVRDSSLAAQSIQYQQEQRLAQAKTEQERQQVRRDSDVYRLDLIFTGQEAKVVQRAIGHEAAQTVLSWCRDEMARRTQQAEFGERA